MELLDVTDSEDELPEGWEERATQAGRVYYANHLTKSTQWEHPITNKEKCLTGELPYGWERTILDNGTIIFVDHINKKTSYTDPRLAFKSNKKKLNERMKNSLTSFDENSNAMDIVKNRDFSGKNAIVTGGNRGLGLEIIKTLALTGCNVIMACRNINLGKDAVDAILKDRPDAKIEVIELNLSSFKSVKNFCDKIKARNCQINMLFLNAAVFETDHVLTENNLELMFQVNFLSQFYLTRLLLNNLISSEQCRIIILACEAHRGGNLSKFDVSATKLNISKSDFNFLQVYCNTKMCNVLFAYELNRRINKMNIQGLACKSCHPGNMLPTKLFKNWVPYRYLSIFTEKFSKSLGQAAATPIFLATASKLSRDPFYWNNLAECDVSQEAQDSVLAYRLWEISESLLIDRTSGFDSFLNDGDQFSSFNNIPTDPISDTQDSLNNQNVFNLNENQNNSTEIVG